MWKQMLHAPHSYARVAASVMRLMLALSVAGSLAFMFTKYWPWQVSTILCLCAAAFISGAFSLLMLMLRTNSNSMASRPRVLTCAMPLIVVLSGVLVGMPAVPKRSLVGVI